MQNKSNGKQKAVAFTMAAMIVSMFLAGCQQAPSKPAETVIKEGMTKLMAVTSGSYEVAFKGDLKDQAGQQIKFDLTTSGQVDVKDPKDPKMTLKLAGSASDGKDMGGEGSLELRLNKEALYFNVMKLSLLKGVGEVPKEVTDMFAKWWKMTLPAGTMDELATSIPSGDEAKMTPEQLKVKKALEEANFFGSPKFVGTENVKGEDSYHYSVTLDKKALVAFMKKAAEAEGQTISESEVADAEKGLAMVDVTGDLYVSIKSGALNKFSGNVKLSGTAADEPSGTITVVATLWDVNNAVTLEVPKDATEFPVEQFLGPLMGGAGGAGSPDLGVPADLSGDLTGGEVLPTEGLPSSIEAEGQPTIEVQ